MTAQAAPAPVASAAEDCKPAAARLVAPGMARLPDLPAGWAAAARRRINVWIGEGMADPDLAGLSPSEVRDHYGQVSYGDRALRTSPEVRRCLDHYQTVVAEVIGTDLFCGDDLQIALRFPGQAGIAHLDGMFEPGRLDDPVVPVAVLGVYLAPVGVDSAPLAYWPGNDKAVAEYGTSFRSDPDLGRERYQELMSVVTAPTPQLMTGGAGSAFLFAGNLPHCNTLHTGEDVRYALFMRFYRSHFYPRGLRSPNGGRGVQILTEPPFADLTSDRTWPDRGSQADA